MGTWCLANLDALGLGCLERYSYAKPRQMIQPEKTVLLLLNRPTDCTFCKHTDTGISPVHFLTSFFFPLGMETHDSLEGSEGNFTGSELATVHAKDVCEVNS